MGKEGSVSRGRSRNLSAEGGMEPMDVKTKRVARVLGQKRLNRI